jgi:signal transduction histidine kinase
VKTQLEETGDAVRNGESLRLELEQSRRELDACRQRLAQIDELFEVHKQSKTLLHGEKNITEMIARGDALQAILEGSCRLVEQALPGSLAIILLLDGKRLRRGAAPSFPKYMAEVDGFEIDPAVGTCSAAAARKEQVITPDIAKDAHWAGYLDLAARHGLKAGWATPVLSSDNQVLGTFGLYWPEPRGPTPEHLQIINQAVRLVAFAIERKRSQDAVSESEHLAQGQLKALTRTLDALAQESNPDRLLEHVLRVIIEQSAAHSVSVWGRDHDAEWVDLIAVFQNGRFQTSKQVVGYPMTRLPSSTERSPIWSEILRTGQYATLEDLDQPIAQMCIGSGSDAKRYPVTSETNPERAMLLHQAYLRALGVRSILFVPMLVAGRVAGLIAIRFSQKRTFLRKEIELTRALAHQAMLALQLTRLSAQNRQADLMAERNRVARDIHDTLAQGFTGIIAQLEAAKGAMSQRKKVRASDHLNRAGELAREGLREARRSVQALRPLALEEKPLATALKDLIKRVTTGTTMEAKLTLQGEPRELPEDVETNLLHIGQEVLTNALRHARASQFDVALVFEGDVIRLTLRDNGCGFDPAKNHEGFGLQGMRERAEDMGGQFSLESSDGNGTVVSILLPLASSAESEPL